MLCDFSDYCDFYYNKLKNNGVIVKKYNKSSLYFNCLRITVPKTGGVKFILELLNKKDLLIFSLDNVIIDIAKIDNERLLITKENLETLSQSYDLVIYSSKNKNNTDYILEEFEIDNIFNFMVTSDDFMEQYLKPDVEGVLKILKHCPHNSVKYIGGSAEDIIAGNKANIETIGIIGPKNDEADTRNNFKHLCAGYIINNTDELMKFLEKNEQI